MSDSSVFHQILLLVVVEHNRVIALMHEEVLHLPLLLVHMLGQLPVMVDGQRELDAPHLQLAVGRKIEHKVVKKLVGGLGNRGLGYQSLCGIEARSVVNQRVGRR